MARIELIDEQPLNVSLSEPQTLNESINPQENINVETTDGWYERSYTETDPIFAQSTAYSITEQDITNWNAKSDFSGDYDDLIDKPTIPSKTSDLTNDSGFLTEHQDISGKVDKETGKGLSSNDFTDTYKNNVDSNTSARHSHSNKSVLDDISSSDISNWDSKQDNLVSGTNIKTINNQSLLGSGNITIQGGGSSTDVQINGTSITSGGEANIITEGTYNETTNKIATMSDIPTVPTVGNAKTYYGTCSTAESTTDKVVVCPNFVLETGATISILFEYEASNTTDMTLNVNNTGAKKAYRTKTRISTPLWSAGEVVSFTYDGNDRWIMHKGDTASTSRYGLVRLSNSVTSTSPSDGATSKAVKIAYDLANSKQDAITNDNKLSYSLLSGTPTIPDELSDLSDDSTHRLVTDTEKTTWNAKSDFSGSYNDLTNKPTIPSKTSDLTNDSGFIDNSYHDSSKQDALVSGTNIKTINNTSLLGSGNINISGGLTIDDIYPVGSIYMSVSSTSPATLFGGTWQQIKDTFLLSCGDTYSNGTTGGSADAVVVSHTHTMESDGTHNHGLKYTNNGGSGTARSVMSSTGTNTSNGVITSDGAHTHTINSSGESGTGKNMPPYLAVYMWKRTA